MRYFRTTFFSRFSVISKSLCLLSGAYWYKIQRNSAIQTGDRSIAICRWCSQPANFTNLQTQIERPDRSPNVSETFDLREVLIINKSLTSSRFQLHGDLQPLTSSRKAAIIATTEPSGELGKNATAQATKTAKPTPHAQPRYPPRQRNTPRGLGFHT